MAGLRTQTRQVVAHGADLALAARSAVRDGTIGDRLRERARSARATGHFLGRQMIVATEVGAVAAAAMAGGIFSTKYVGKGWDDLPGGSRIGGGRVKTDIWGRPQAPKGKSAGVSKRDAARAASKAKAATQTKLRREGQKARGKPTTNGKAKSSWW